MEHNAEGEKPIKPIKLAIEFIQLLRYLTSLPIYFTGLVIVFIAQLIDSHGAEERTGLDSVIPKKIMMYSDIWNDPREK